MDDLRSPVPPEDVTIEAVPARSEPVMGYLPGDFLLGKAHGFNHRLIKLGQWMRTRGSDRRYIAYTHAALVVSSDGKLIEAIGEGVRCTTITAYVEGHEDYQVVRITATESNRQEVVDFAERVVQARKPYDFLAPVSTGFWALSGSRLTFFLDGSYTCSGLVAAALQRAIPDELSPARVMPAQLAMLFAAPPPPPDPPWVMPRPPAWLQRRRRG